MKQQQQNPPLISLDLQSQNLQSSMTDFDSMIIQIIHIICINTCNNLETKYKPTGLRRFLENSSQFRTVTVGNWLGFKQVWSEDILTNTFLQFFNT